MNTRRVNIITIFMLASLFISCSYDFPVEPESTEGENLPENFSEFFVLGDTYASGFMDGALYNGGQEFSYPGIFGGKLNQIYSEPVFQQAEVVSEAGFNAEATANEGSTMGRYRLLYRSTLSIYPARSPITGDEVMGWDGSLENLKDYSLPGLKSFEVDSSEALTQNEYFSRLGLGNTTLTDALIDRQPVAALINLGYQDILNYALNGGAGDENPNPALIGDADLTPVSVFENTMNSLINRILDETGSDVFVANLFNPLVAPYFQALSHALEIEKYSSGYLGNVGSHYADFNYNVFQYNDVEDGGAPPELDRPIIVVDPMGYPQISPSNRARVIVDEYLNDASLNDGTVLPKWRQLKENELVLYKNEPELNESSPLSAEVPLTDAQALTEAEIEFINQRVEAFNTIIEGLASNNDRVHLVNVRSVITSVNEDEYIFDGVRPSVDFDRYGIFSGDGYTLNPRGNAILANELIKTVNAVYDAKLNLVNVNEYRGTEILSNFD